MITQLTLDNFKCFEHQRLTLSPLTLLTGVNGMGKSTAMQALLLLRQSVRANLLPDVGVLLDGELVHLGTAADALYDGARGEDADSIRITVQMAETDTFFFRLDASDKTANVLPVSAVSFIRHHRSALFGAGRDGGGTVAQDPFRFNYLAAERLGPRDIHDVSQHHVQHLHDLGSTGAYAVAYLDAHGSGQQVEQAMRRSDAASSQLLSQVTSWLGEISPGVRIATLEYQELGRAALSLSFVSGQATSRKLRPTGVGFGLSYTLPVLVALLSSRPGDLVLIENPEAHLHPRGQFAMGSLMARAAAAQVQVLCETHSDHVLNGVRLAVRQGVLPHGSVALHYFSRGDDGERIVHRVESPQMDSDGRIDPWPEGFFDQWDIALEKLI